MENKTNLEVALKAAVKAGEKILEIYNDPNSDFSVEKKADNSPLTIADKISHTTIQHFLSDTEFPVLSEEGRSIEYPERKDWQNFWIVDPLDGTKEFIKKNGEFTVNIALAKNGKPVLGVIYVPVSKTLYFGNIGLGAFICENVSGEITFDSVLRKSEKLPKPKTTEKYFVVGSRSHMSPETEEYIDALKQKHAEIDIISKGSSLKICMVAEGIADEYPRFGPTMEWDTAAGHAIANAAGKKLWLTDLSEELAYNKENLLNPYFIVK
ncbi:3'(2'),5'-bisphosphate nucleotidase CysQ [Maribellus comscasis]|uniref:3'(2'),5'-bisphosphate nucleotidase CysQ n=1 Tax=Maribellus comscasis TaxID=2681766 RepID=A0A6I6JPU4_9BACT|nr:3'(2'),5'-bisphosphate nucleotidase CysQ [Maribellus comscasis]QGY42252.1 3'(2'),5'-bisphosphate nucleotidase CysQ [Maribellus comscasis]